MNIAKTELFLLDNTRIRGGTYSDMQSLLWSVWTVLRKRK